LEIRLIDDREIGNVSGWCTSRGHLDMWIPGGRVVVLGVMISIISNRLLSSEWGRIFVILIIIGKDSDYFAVLGGGMGIFLQYGEKGKEYGRNCYDTLKLRYVALRYAKLRYTSLR